MRLTPLEPWIAGTIGAATDPLTCRDQGKLRGGSLDRRDLERHQLDRLRATVDLARSRSPFYRQLLADVPTPDRLADLGTLPFTTPEDLVAQGLRMVCVPQDDIARVVTLDTSGTTGAPKRVWFTAADAELTVDFFRAGMSTFTAPGDRVLILLPGERPGSVGKLLATALRRLGAVPIPHGVVQDVDATLTTLRTEDVDVAVGIPTHLLALARRDAAPRLKAVLLSTDHVPAAIVRAVEGAWGCAVFNHWGMTETGLGGGVECEARRGYHLREADLLVETVDPVTGAAVTDGAEGEVVVTTLTRHGTPLLRYRTGDLSRFVPGPCPCGTALRTLERITRRAAGVLTLPDGGRLALADLDEALFAVEVVLDFDATLVRGARTDRLELAVRLTDGAPAGIEGVLTAAVAAVPAVGRARASGTLTLTLTAAPARSVASPAKRRLKEVMENSRYSRSTDDEAME